MLLAAAPLAVARPVAAEAKPTVPPWPGFCYERDRFGFWDVGNRIDAYDVGLLHAGWYNHYTVIEEPSHPGGMRFVQLVRIYPPEPAAGAACAGCPTWDEVRAIAQQNPGSLWLIGNEPDRQDYVAAERYAQIYHDFYDFLKAEDPASQVAIGGVVQPTPIRLQYLDLILDAYQAQYGEMMPVDVWNVHNYVLREKDWYPGCPDCWGCDIPPGTDPELGILYEIEDHDNLVYWTGQLRAMRTWMRDRGYRDRPLIVSEYGILMWTLFGYDYPRVRDFMLSTFDWMTTATDPDTGYPADGNRLVQAWSWYSLAQSTFEGRPVASHLFDPATREITELGRDFGAYTAPLAQPFPGTVDLQVTAIRHGVAAVGAGGLLTTTVTAQVTNGGASPAGEVQVHFYRDGMPAGEATLEALGAGDSQPVSVVWTNLEAGPYTVRAVADPEGLIAECNSYNNERSSSLMVSGIQIYLPLIGKGG